MILTCEDCGEEFTTTSQEEAKEMGWIMDEDEAFCPDHKHYHPDYWNDLLVQIREKRGCQLEELCLS